MARKISIVRNKNWSRHRGGRGLAISMRMVDAEIPSIPDRRSISLSQPVAARIAGIAFAAAMVVGLTAAIALAFKWVLVGY